LRSFAFYDSEAVRAEFFVHEVAARDMNWDGFREMFVGAFLRVENAVASVAILLFYEMVLHGRYS
jgi:hypothetical protein